MNFRNLTLFLFFTVIACDKGEALYPEVLTDDPQQIGITSVVIEGNIKETGSVRPIRYGFLWDTVGDLNILSAKNRLDLGSTNLKKIYSIKLDNLTPNTEYFVKAYTASMDYSKLYYGNEISFRTLQ